METIFDEVSEGALLLDIRSREEYCRGHLCGSILVTTPLPPLSADEKDTLKSALRHVLYDRATTPAHLIFVYCKKGIRARLAVEYIRSFGYYNVVSLGGVETGLLKNIFDERLQTRWSICNC